MASGDVVKKSVLTAWDLSFTQLRDESAAAAELLELCSLLASEGIPGRLLAGVGGAKVDGGANEVFGALCVHCSGRWSIERMSSSCWSTWRRTTRCSRETATAARACTAWSGRCCCWSVSCFELRVETVTDYSRALHVVVYTARGFRPIF